MHSSLFKKNAWNFFLVKMHLFVKFSTNKNWNYNGVTSTNVFLHLIVFGWGGGYNNNTYQFYVKHFIYFILLLLSIYMFLQQLVYRKTYRWNINWRKNPLEKPLAFSFLNRAQTGFHFLIGPPTLLINKLCIVANSIKNNTIFCTESFVRSILHQLFWVF